MFVDSHCHINYPEFEPDFDEMLSRARKNHVSHMLAIATKLSDVPALKKIAQKYANIFYSVGVHPHDSQDLPTEQELLALVGPKVVAFGETGLDYYYNNAPKNVQQESFRRHIRAAEAAQLPLIIHCRDAEQDVVRLLEEEGAHKRKRPGVIHCFTGSAEFAQVVLEMGFYISISGIVTFKKSEELQEIVKKIPLDNLLIETDSPFLAPIPHRGHRNEPSFVVHVAQKISELKNISCERIAEKTTYNFFQLFSKAKQK